MMTEQKQAIPEGYKQTEVGVIPSDWECVELGALDPFVTSGSRGWAAYYSIQGDVFVRITNMSRESIYLDLNNVRYVSVSSESSEGVRTSLQNRDVLISITADIGICSYVDDSLIKPAFINQHIALVRFDHKAVDSKFIAYYLSSYQIQKLFKGSTDQGAKAGMNLDAVRKIKTALPSKQEQTAIANALSDVDALISELEKLIAKKQAIKTATMQQLLTGKTRLPEFALREDGTPKGYKQSELGEIPEDWEVNNLQEISSMRGRIGWQGLKQEEFTFNDREPFLITGMNFKDGKIRWNEVYHIPESRYEMDKNIQLNIGDILMTKDGTIGKLLFVDNIPSPYKATLNSHLLLFRPKNEAYEPRFLYCLMKTRLLTDHIDLHKSGSTFFGITQSAMSKLNIILPPKPEQKIIADTIFDMDEDLDFIIQRLEKIKQIKQGMMQELLTGKTRLVKPEVKV